MRSQGSVRMLSATSRSGEGFRVLSEHDLAQARRLRLSEISWSCVMSYVICSTGEVWVWFWANVWLSQARGSRLSEIT